MNLKLISIVILVLLCLGCDQTGPSVTTSNQRLNQLAPSYADDAETATVLNQQATAHYQAGRYAEAIPLLEQALAIFEKVLGPDHPHVATNLNNLAELYRTQGQYDRAEPRYQRALAIFEKALGPDHPDVAMSLNNLALLYSTQGQFDRAEPRYQRALAIFEKALGPDHPDVAMSLNNLAELYRTQGRYDRAEPRYQRALAIYEKALGPDHPNVATSLNNLATLYATQGRYDQTEPRYQRALAIVEKALGPDHPDVATSLSSLATLYATQGQFDRAEPRYQRALAIVEKALGPDHPDVATSLNNLAELYQTQGRYDRAEPRYQRALAIFEKALGPDHPDVATSLNNLAELYQTQGRYDRAEPRYQRALAISEKALGPDHPHVATSLNNLAELYRTQGRYDQAEPRYQRALAIYEKALGPDHPHVATSLNNLAELYRTQGRYDQAEPRYQRALVIVEKALGDAHPDTAQVLINYAVLLHQLNQTAGAIFYGKRAVNVLQASRESNQQLSDALRNSFLTIKESDYRIVADWLLEAGRLTEAEQVLAMLKEDEQFQYLRRNQAATQFLNTRAACAAWEERHCVQYQKTSTDLREVGKTIQQAERDPVETARLKELQQLLNSRKVAFADSLTQINNALQALQGDPEYKLHVEKDVLQRSNGARRRLREVGHGAVSLHYLLMAEGVKIILTTPEKQLVRNSEIKLPMLRRKVGVMRQAILRQQQLADFKVLSEELYALLVLPVADELIAADAKTLLVSLDGILRYLPFSALYDGKQFLIERYAVNFQTLAARMDWNTKPQSSWRVAGFGVSKAADITDPVTLKPMRFDPLPFVATELKTLIRQNDKEAGLLPGEIYLDDAFSKQQLTKVLGHKKSSPVIHIGSHFELRPGDSSRSFLLLGQNTVLTMAEVYDENLDFSGTDLVTLSACETAMGEDNALSNGAEIESFGVLVQDRGAKSVLATLWPVVDESTSVFMQNFYQLREQKKLTKVEALRQAQRSMINSGAKFAHPYYWAPFVLMGNWL